MGRRTIGTSAAVVLVVTVLAGALTFSVAGSADAGLTTCRQHRLDARARAEVVTGTGPRVLVIGDSWSVGMGQDDLADGWPKYLAGEVHVAGFSGSAYSARASRCGTVSFHDRAPTALAAVRPALVVVEGGLNDYDQPGRAIDRGFRDLMADLAGQRVVVLGPASAPSRAGAVPRIEAQLRTLVDLYDVPYVQTSDLGLDYLSDRLHLTEDGHRAFGEAIAARLAETHPARPAVFRN